MRKPFKPNRQSVELRPSKIRRDPPPPAPAVKASVPHEVTERETWAVLLGVLLFGIAITIIIFAASDYTAG